MLRAMFMHLWAIPVLGWHLILALPAEGWRHVWKRLPLFLFFWLLFSLLNCLHLAGHLLDEILFRGYRNRKIKRPVFILGIPRSGTTYLHRLLGSDARFTTFTTWEALLAPSLTERYLYRILGLLLTPVGHVAVAVRRKLFHRMDRIHRIRLLEPEEDFLLLLPVLACFLLAFPCPGSRCFWRLGQADQCLSARRQQRLLDFYHACLQKHLYYHGDNLAFLSKNPSFTSWLPALLAHYPDARVIACTRHPLEVLPSQLSAISPAMGILGGKRLSAGIQDGLLDVLHHYYELLGKYRQNKQIFFLPMTALQHDLSHSLHDLGIFLAVDHVNAAPLAALAETDTAASGYKSRHVYTLEDFSLTTDGVNALFADVWPLPASVSGKDA